MTLVVAHGVNSQVSLSSDSRISFADGQSVDYGIKIFAVPVKVYGPTDSETHKAECYYDHRIGLAVVGSTINAYTVKEAVYEILQHLQFIPGYTDFSMEGIAKMVMKIYRKAALDLGAILREKGLCELILTGYCPLNTGIRTFYFTCDTSAYPIVPKFSEILTGNGMSFFGSGTKAAADVADKNPHFNPLQIIRKVVQEKRSLTVGGSGQFGKFDDYLNFEILGVQDYELNEDGSLKEYVNMLRGINWHKDEFEQEADGFHVSYNYIMPFQRDIDEIWRKNLDGEIL